MIGREAAKWRWQVLGKDGGVLGEGVCASKAQAAALVIRGLVRAETGDPQARPRALTTAQAA